MKVLALDTSSKTSVVALLDSESGAFVFETKEVSVHSESLLSMVQGCLAANQMSCLDFSGIVCGAGPGSFTGLRVGLATAKGLSYSCHIPLVLVSSLYALAAPFLEQTNVLVCVSATRGRLYARLFRKGYVPWNEDVDRTNHLFQERVWEPQVLCDALQRTHLEVIVCGNGPEQCMDLVEGRVWNPDVHPQPEPFARIGVSLLQRGIHDSVDDALPNYVMMSAAEEKQQSSSLL